MSLVRVFNLVFINLIFYKIFLDKIIGIRDLKSEIVLLCFFLCWFNLGVFLK